MEYLSMSQWSVVGATLAGGSVFVGRWVSGVLVGWLMEDLPLGWLSVVRDRRWSVFL